MTLRTPQQAVAYARQHLNTGYNGLCLAHVQDAYGAAAVEPSAISAWNNSKHKHPTTDLASAPYGAPIYWSQPGNPYGHIALHLNGDRMYTTDSAAGRPHEAGIRDWQTRYGYQPLGWTEDIENQLIPGMGGTTMAITTEEAKQIAAEVWSYQYDPKQPNMYNAIQYELGGKVWGYNYKGSAPGGNVYNTLVYETQGKLKQLQTTVTAQAAAIEALAKSMGADPEQIAQAVQDAVTAKLDSLEITITATDGTDQ